MEILNEITEIDYKSADAVRILSIDAVTNAKSGHPGMPLGASTFVYALFRYHMRFDPSDPWWFNRDRFVLSSGHASAMLYSLLHLFGYDISLDDIRNFRKIDSKTCGHPEYPHTPGVEVTTGPLGQGFACACGMAWASKYLAGIFNKDDIKIIDNRIYVVCGEGDLMEGISYEAASFAGHNRLSNLTVIYDSNRVTIEGSADITFTEDLRKRFESCGWKVFEVDDGYDMVKINKAIEQAKNTEDYPSFIIVKTNIGYKSPKQDSNKVHGEPLTEQEIKQTRKNLGWEYDEMFYVPQYIRDHFRKITESKIIMRKKWDKILKDYRSKYPSDYEKLNKYINNSFEFDFDFNLDEKSATRNSSYKVLNYIADKVENIVGGSADLAPSTKTKFDKYPNRNIHFGVREHAMAAIVNGINLYGGLRAFCSTFLVFSDYMKPAMRLSAMMKLKSIYIFTHDSIGVGEDGPTHQPVEHIMSLRMIPDMIVIRPADSNEVVEAWRQILKLNKTVSLILSRQDLAALSQYSDRIKKYFHYGAYNLVEEEKPQAILIATGSEVHIALEVRERLVSKGIGVNVVSMPCFEIFKEADESYKKKILIPGIAKFVIEAGRTYGWSDIIGEKVWVFGVDSFGYSGKGEDVYKKFGLTSEQIAVEIEKIIKFHQG